MESSETARLCSAHRPTLLEAFAAENRAALRGTEWHRGFFAALRAVGFGFGAHLDGRTTAHTIYALGFAGLATLGFVLEALVGKEHLFAGSKNKFGATLRTLQDLIVVFH